MKKIPIQIQGGDPTMIEELELIVKSVEGFTISKIPSIVIIDVRDEGDLEEVVRLIESGGNVFLTSKNADSQLLMKAMNTGVKGFFQQPLNQKEVVAALEKFREQQQIVEVNKLGQITTVIGSKGGVGTTTIAVNLAILFAKMKADSSVCLVDLNPVCGETHLFLDMAHLYHWGEVARNIERLDSTLLMNVLAKHKSGVHLLAAPTVLTEENPQAVSQILMQIQKIFDFIVIDGGSKMNAITLRAFETSNEILLISRLNILSLASTVSLIKGFAKHGFNPKEKVKIVVNRYDGRRSDVQVQQAETMLNAGMFQILPEDKIAGSAINNGQPLVDFAPKSRMAKSLYSMAENLFPEDNNNTNRRLNLFRR